MWIEKRLPTEKRLAPLFYQLVSAVLHTHESGFVHRDIKLENVFFKDKQETEVLLGDWELATPYSQTTILTLDCGTLHYCAPEILDHCPYIGPEVDIWSLGVCLYAALTDYFPFRGNTPIEKLLDIQTPISFPSGVSLEFQSIVNSFLQPAPHKRVALSVAIQHPWFKLYMTPDELVDSPAPISLNTSSSSSFPSLVCTSSSLTLSSSVSLKDYFTPHHRRPQSQKVRSVHLQELLLLFSTEITIY